MVRNLAFVFCLFFTSDSLALSNEGTKQEKPAHIAEIEDSIAKINAKRENDDKEGHGNTDVTESEENIYNNAGNKSISDYVGLENQKGLNDTNEKDVSGEMLMGLNAQNLVRHLSNNNISWGAA